jgi:predicted aspartyl protease
VERAMPPLNKAPVFALVALGLTVLAGAARADPAPARAKCQLREIAEFPIVMNGNQPVIESTINGHPVNLLVDTGSVYNILWRPSAQALGLALRPLPGVQFFGVGGGDVAQIANVHELKLGGMTLHDRDFVVSGESRVGSTVGTLGANLFVETDVEFDLPHRVIRMFDQKGCSGDQVVYWGQAYSVAPIAPSNDELKLEVYVLINGQRVLALLDSGASTTVLTTGAAERVGVKLNSDGVKEVGKSTGVGLKSVQDYMATFSSFTIGDQETVKNPKLRIADLFADAAATPINSRIAKKIDDLPDMLLGADFFLSHRIFLARSQGKIYVSYQGGPIFQLQASSSAPAVTAPPSQTTPVKP